MAGTTISMTLEKTIRRDAVVRYVKDVVSNVPAQNDIPVIQIETKTSQINDTIELFIKDRFIDNFGVVVSSVDIGAIEIDKSSEAYRQLMSVTKDVTTATVEAKKEAEVKNIHDMQRIEAENYEETLRIQREESQYSMHKDTQTRNIAAFQVESQKEVGVAGAEALGQMGANGAGGVSLGEAGGTGFNPAAMMASMAVGGAVGQNIAGTMNGMIEKVKEELTFENVLMTAIRTPGVKINRAKFLKKELMKCCSEEVIEEAIKSNPAKAGISKDVINIISKQVVNYESTKVTTISVAASIPGGVAAVGAAAVDITSYFAFVLRVVQELAYLYGFEQFEFKDEEIDSETMNFVLVFIGVMFGVQGAASTLQKLANTLAKHVSKRLARKALTKGTIYPIVKRIATKVGIRMTKQIFADSVASVIPVVGGALSGGLTYAMFKPGCMKLRKNLMSYNLCNPKFYESNAPDSVMDVEYEECVED